MCTCAPECVRACDAYVYVHVRVCMCARVCVCVCVRVCSFVCRLKPVKPADRTLSPSPSPFFLPLFLPLYLSIYLSLSLSLSLFVRYVYLPIFAIGEDDAAAPVPRATTTTPRAQFSLA